MNDRSGTDVGWEQIVIGAGADDLIMLCARTYLGPGRTAAIVAADLLVLPHRHAAQRGGAGRGDRGCEPDLALQPGESDRGSHARQPSSSNWRDVIRAPRSIVDEAYIEFGGESVVPWLDECPNLIVLRTMSKAFGYAAPPRRLRRCGTRRRLRCWRRAARRRRSPRRRPASPLQHCAIRGYDLDSEVDERERVRAALVAAGFDAPPAAGQLRLDSHRRRPRAPGSKRKGIIVRSFPQGIRVTLRRPSENDVFLGRSAPSRAPSRGARRR